MLEKLIRENTIPTVLFILLYLFFSYQSSPEHVEMVNYLAITGYGTSIITTTLFFIIPAKFGGIAFSFMFLSIVLRLFLFGILTIFGLEYIDSNYTSDYFLLQLINLIVYKISGTYYFENESSKKQLKKETL